MIRRTLFLLLFALWQGGFMFYGAIVVPVGARVLESETEQGFITQQVTPWLNGCGLVALAAWLWMLLAERQRDYSTRRPLVLWGLLLGSLVLQVVLHGRMSVLLDLADHSVRDPEQFYTYHRLYLTISTCQWLLAIALLTITVRRWSSRQCTAMDIGMPTLSDV